MHRKRSINILNKLKPDQFVSKILVPNHSKTQRYEALSDKWKQILTIDHAKVTQFVFNHDTNTISNDDTYDYIPIPLHLLSLIESSPHKVQKTLLIKNVDTFCETLSGIEFKKKRIKISSFEFTLRIYPNGLTDINHGFIGYFVELTRKPIDIEYIVIYIDLYCIQTNTKHKKTVILREIADSEGLMWSLSIKQCQQHNTLQFGANLEILQIVFKNTLQDTQDYVSLVNNGMIHEYEWKSSEVNHILNAIKQCKHNRHNRKLSFWSNNNTKDDMFCFEIEYEYEQENDVENMYIHCKLLRLPPHLEGIKVLFVFRMGYPQYRNTITMDYKHSDYRLKLIQDDIEWLLDNAADDDDDIHFEIRVEITKEISRTRDHFMKCWLQMNECLAIYYTLHQRDLGNTFLEYIQTMEYHQRLISEIVKGNESNDHDAHEMNWNWNLLSQFEDIDLFPISQSISVLPMIQKRQFISYLLSYFYLYQQQPSFEEILNAANCIRNNGALVQRNAELEQIIEKEKVGETNDIMLIAEENKQWMILSEIGLEKENVMHDMVKMKDMIKELQMKKIALEDKQNELQYKQNEAHSVIDGIVHQRKDYALVQKKYEERKKEIHEKRKQNVPKMLRYNHHQMRKEIQMKTKIKQELKVFMEHRDGAIDSIDPSEINHTPIQTDDVDNDVLKEDDKQRTNQDTEFETQIIRYPTHYDSEQISSTINDHGDSNEYEVEIKAEMDTNSSNESRSVHSITHVYDDSDERVDHDLMDALNDTEYTHSNNDENGDNIGENTDFDDVENVIPFTSTTQRTEDIEQVGTVETNYLDSMDDLMYRSDDVSDDLDDIEGSDSSAEAQVDGFEKTDSSSSSCAEDTSDTSAESTALTQQTDDTVSTVQVYAEIVMDDNINKMEQHFNMDAHESESNIKLNTASSIAVSQSTQHDSMDTLNHTEEDDANDSDRTEEIEQSETGEKNDQDVADDLKYTNIEDIDGIKAEASSTSCTDDTNDSAVVSFVVTQQTEDIISDAPEYGEISIDDNPNTEIESPESNHTTSSISVCQPTDSVSTILNLPCIGAFRGNGYDNEYVDDVDGIEAKNKINDIGMYSNTILKTNDYTSNFSLNHFEPYMNNTNNEKKVEPNLYDPNINTETSDDTKVNTASSILSPVATSFDESQTVDASRQRHITSDDIPRLLRDDPNFDLSKISFVYNNDTAPKYDGTSMRHDHIMDYTQYTGDPRLNNFIHPTDDFNNQYHTMYSDRHRITDIQSNTMLTQPQYDQITENHENSIDDTQHTYPDELTKSKTQLPLQDDADLKTYLKYFRNMIADEASHLPSIDVDLIETLFQEAIYSMSYALAENQFNSSLSEAANTMNIYSNVTDFPPSIEPSYLESILRILRTSLLLHHVQYEKNVTKMIQDETLCRDMLELEKDIVDVLVKQIVRWLQELETPLKRYVNAQEYKRDLSRVLLLWIKDIWITPSYHNTWFIYLKEGNVVRSSLERIEFVNILREGHAGLSQLYQTLLRRLSDKDEWNDQDVKQFNHEWINGKQQLLKKHRVELVSFLKSIRDSIKQTKISHMVKGLVLTYDKDIKQLIEEGSFKIDSESNLIKFCTLHAGKRFAKRKIEIQDFVFKLYLYPNGSSKNTKGYVQFGITLNIPSRVESVVIYCKLFERTTNTEFHHTLIFDDKTATHVIKWHQFLLSLKCCKKQNELEFGYIIQILQIRTKDGTVSDYTKNMLLGSPEMTSILARWPWNWKMDKHTIDQIAKNPVLYNKHPQNNAMCCSLRTVPNKKYLNILISFHIFQLPPTIEKLDATFEVNTNAKHLQIKRKKQHLFDYNSSECSIELDRKQSEKLLSIAKTYQQSRTGEFCLNITYKIDKVYFRGYMDDPHDTVVLDALPKLRGNTSKETSPKTKTKKTKHNKATKRGTRNHKQRKRNNKKQR